MLSITIDDSQFRTQMLRFVTELGLQAADVVRDQTRLLLKQVINLTPPKTLAQGRIAAARDIGRAMRPIETSYMKLRTRDRLELLAGQGNIRSMQAIVNNMKPFKNFTVQPFSPALHISVRDQMIASKKFRARVFIAGTREGKGKEAISTGQTKQWFKYVAQIQKHAGRLKAAWGVAYQSVGGKLPGWIAKHKDPHGTVHPHFENPQHPSIEFRNFAVGVGKQERMFAAAMKIRANSMRLDIGRRLKRAALKAGFA